MSENLEFQSVDEWLDAWKTEEGKERLMRFFRRIPRQPAQGSLVKFRPLMPEPETKPKHDGYLDEDKQYTVSLSEDASLVSLFDPKGFIHLYASEALSLLAWLEQNREKLEQKAKEQS